jgi:hypothetical protein
MTGCVTDGSELNTLGASDCDVWIFAGRKHQNFAFGIRRTALYGNFPVIVEK